MQSDSLPTATAQTPNTGTPTTRQAHSLIGSDRVEGTAVRSSDGSRLGTIERVMIDKLSGTVAYAVLSFGGFLGMGQRHLPIPWARLKYDRTLGGYQLDLTDEELARAPTFAAQGFRLGRPQPRDRGAQFLQGAALLGRVLNLICVDRSVSSGAGP
jgi:hypothetical protein